MKPVLTLLVLASADKARFFDATVHGHRLTEIECVLRSAQNETRADPTDHGLRGRSGPIPADRIETGRTVIE